MPEPVRRLMNSLSARLLVLTILFVMLVEVLVFVPSVSRFRTNYLQEKLGAAHLAVLTLDATPDGMASEELTDQLLSHVGALAISARRDEARMILRKDMPIEIDGTVDLREMMSLMTVGDALSALVIPSDRIIRVIGPSPKDPQVEVEVVIDERPLCEAIVAFAERILLLSLLISLVTGVLVYLVLRWQFVRPMRRLTKHMLAFREDPEDARRIISASGRNDELGIAERQLADMQTAVRNALGQRRRLAALGTAVAKINHDLRGVLSSALLMSDRLESSDDPEVRRVTPVLIASIERAVGLCSQTLGYAGQDQPPLNRSTFELAPLVADAGAGLDQSVEVRCDVASDVSVHADREQIFRVLNNLIRNAAQAGADRITVTCTEETDRLLVEVMDDGPGLPPRASEKLFQPFEGSARAGGTGLGLAIARELARNHGGDLVLVSTGAGGTRFCLILPFDDESGDA